MSRSKVIGALAWIVGGFGVVFRQAISSAFGKIADAMLKDDFAAKAGKFVTFTLADVLIIGLFGIGLVVLCWPLISKFIQSETERKSLRSPKFHRKVFVDCQFELERDGAALAASERDVFVDCTFKGEHLGFVDCKWFDGYRVNAKNNVIVTGAEIIELRKYIPVVGTAILSNTQIFVDNFYMEAAQAAELYGANQPTHVKPLDIESLKPNPFLDRARKRLNSFIGKP